MKYDLHVHSNVSDGKLTREELINLAVENNLKYLCFADHNLFDDSLHLKKKYVDKIAVLNGIEFDAIYRDTTFHALCYFKLYDSSINEIVTKYKENTNDRSEMLLKKINQVYGINSSIADLKNDLKKDFVSKRDIIDWLVDNRYAMNVKDATSRFTSKRAPSYVQKYSLDSQTIFDCIHNLNGKIILAHPTTLKLNPDVFEEKLIKLIANGLDGIEVVNSSRMSDEDTQFFLGLANKYNLLTSGGSDFHDARRGHILGIENDYSNQLIKKIK